MGKAIPQGEMPSCKALPASCSESEHLKSRRMTFNYPSLIDPFPKKLF